MFTQSSCSRFVLWDTNGEVREHLVVAYDLFSRLFFHGLPPLDVDTSAVEIGIIPGGILFRIEYCFGGNFENSLQKRSCGNIIGFVSDCKASTR